MDFEQLALKRQSTREYSAKPVSDEDLQKICRIAQNAPSAVNSQPYKLFAVNGEKAKQFAKFVQILGGNKWASDCASFIAIKKGKPAVVERLGQKLVKTEFLSIDIGILSAFITLAAEDMGIQTCILGMRNEREIAAFLNEPEGSEFPLVIALGYAPEGYPVRKKSRKDFEEYFKLIK